MSAADTRTPPGAQAVSSPVTPSGRYRCLPSLVMPEPSIPDGIVPPQRDIHELFELRLATDATTATDGFSVRWQVYCQEFGYEPAGRFPDRRERDEADRRAVQVVAYYRPTGMPVACYRLLLADPDEVAAPFHLEQVCCHLDPGAIPSVGPGRMGFAEISRFCVIASFRHFARTADNRPPAGVGTGRWRAEAPRRLNLAVLLWLSAAHLAVHLRLDYILALMEPQLRLLGRRVGFVFQPIGPGVEFRGLRIPYRIDRRALRALLQVSETAALLAPVTPPWQAQARSHPLLAPYLDAPPLRTAS